MKKLLHVPLKAFAAYSLLVLSLSIPVYYFVVDAIWIHELDNHNRSKIEKIQEFLAQKAQTSDEEEKEEELGPALKIWNQIQTDTRIDKASFRQFFASDSTFTITQKEEDNEEERYRVRVRYARIGKDIFRIKTQTNVEEADETLLAIASITAFFFALLIGGFILLNQTISRKTWIDFEHTLLLLKDFDITRQKVLEPKPTEIREFYELNEHLKELTASSISAFAKQKRFIENASHELQTPLAILRSKLDLLLENSECHSNHAELISSIHKQISRVTRINKNLLFLAKIENHQFPEFETLDLCHIVDECLKSITEVFGMDPAKIHCDFREGSLIAASPVLVEVLINNLVVNALVHNIKDGEIWVRIQSRTFLIENSGTVPLKEGVIFDRFSIPTDRNTRSGLGLSIVKEICNSYGWEVEYQFAEKRHCFKINF